MKFTDLLEELLELRDRAKSDYYENRYIGERTNDQYRMIELKEQLNEMYGSMNSRGDK